MPLDLLSVASQDFRVYPASPVHVILGNDALIKCDIPSFVADFVSVTSWIDNEGNDLRHHGQGDYSRVKSKRNSPLRLKALHRYKAKISP